MTSRSSPPAWSFHRPGIDGRGGRSGRQEGDRLAGVIDRLDLFTYFRSSADVHSEPVVGANERGDRLAVVVRSLGHDQPGRIIRMRCDPLAGFLVGRVEFWNEVLVLLGPVRVGG